jgi:DNA-binding transcriptional MocR family regulator
MHPDVRLLLANERLSELREQAARERLAREATNGRSRLRRIDDGAHVTLRLDTAGDSARLYQLANLNERRLGPGPFVVAEVDGRVIGFLSLAGGGPVVDPAESAKNLVSLLELRAAQIRRTDRRFRLLPRFG